ncbi:hypothetical protein [Pseudomonas silesiensis]|uniref:hypothetical protein n=1 Tax=Pseudomonas silesiensis TaxID=1853130 RepID=UPI0034D6CC47
MEYTVKPTRRRSNIGGASDAINMKKERKPSTRMINWSIRVFFHVKDEKCHAEIEQLLLSAGGHSGGQPSRRVSIIWYFFFDEMTFQVKLVTKKMTLDFRSKVMPIGPRYGY